MKNIVMVSRFNAPRARLYELPDGVSVKAGTLCSVEYADGSTATGVTVSDSYTISDSDEVMIAELLHLIPKTLDLKKVVSVYDEIPLDHGNATEEDETNA